MRRWLDKIYKQLIQDEELGIVQEQEGDETREFLHDQKPPVTAGCVHRMKSKGKHDEWKRPGNCSSYVGMIDSSMDAVLTIIVM